MSRFLCVLGLSVLLAPSAQAVTWEKDVRLWGRVDRPQGDFLDGDVTLDKVRAYHCTGGTYVDFVVDEVVDPVAGFYATVSATGDYCSITWVFSSDFVIDGVGGAFTVESSDAEVPMTASASMGWVALSPFVVTSGTMPGAAGPHLTAWTE